MKNCLCDVYLFHFSVYIVALALSTYMPIHWTLNVQALKCFLFNAHHMLEVKLCMGNNVYIHEYTHK